jgi:hypothetical protein
MTKLLKYLGIFCLFALALSMTFCSVGVYQVMQTANRTFAGADNYTCRQFLYDIDRPETDKLPPLLIASAAYGLSPDAKASKERKEDILDIGMLPSVRKVYALCKGNPSERVLNLFTATVTGATTVSNTQNNNISGTVPVSPTLTTGH